MRIAAVDETTDNGHFRRAVSIGVAGNKDDRDFHAELADIDEEGRSRVIEQAIELFATEDGLEIVGYHTSILTKT